MTETPTQALHRAAADLRRDPERKHAWELAVADWLDDVAEANGLSSDPAEGWPKAWGTEWPHAVGIARAYLGEDETPCDQRRYGNPMQSGREAVT